MGLASLQLQTWSAKRAVRRHVACHDAAVLLRPVSGSYRSLCRWQNRGHAAREQLGQALQIATGGALQVWVVQVCTCTANRNQRTIGKFWWG